MMKRLACFSFAVMASLVSFAQMFTPVEGEKKGDTVVFNSKGNTVKLLPQGTTGLKIMGENTVMYNTTNGKCLLRWKLLTNNKFSTSYLFVEQYEDLSLGCRVYQIKNSHVSLLGEFPVAAYTSENGGRMNFNSILPYVSVIRAKSRTLLCFEKEALVVLQPNTHDEQIRSSRELYWLIDDKACTMQMCTY